MKEQLGNAVFIGNHEADSPEWHELRSQSIGGSEIGTIMGLNPWESAFTLMHKKLKLIPDKIEPNWSIRFGKAFESPILSMFLENHPEYEFVTSSTWRSKDFDWQQANPDAVIQHKETGEYAIVEIKTSRAPWDSIPPAYEAQLMWYLDTFGFKKGFMVAVAGWNWEEHEIAYDEFYADVLRQHAQRFWTALQKQEIPDWDGSQSTYETVRRTSSNQSEGKFESGELGINLVVAQIKADEATAHLNAMKAATLAQMGNAKFVTVTLDDGVEDVVASKQRRGDGLPYLQVKKTK